MKELSKEKTITVRELSELLGINQETIKVWIRKLYPNMMVNGKQTFLNETVVTEIKSHIGTGRNDLQNVLQVKKINTDIDMQEKALEVMQWMKGKIELLKQENEIMRPKADYYDALVDSNSLSNFRDTAKEIGLRQSDFISLLLSDKYIYRDHNNQIRPRAGHEGLFELKEFKSEDSGYDGKQTFITVRGREKFLKLYGVKK